MCKGTELKMGRGIIKECECGAPLKIKCADGHDTCEIVNWYVPRSILVSMINKNIQKIFKDYSLEYNICIVGDMGYIVNGTENLQTEVEIPFATIECFKHEWFSYFFIIINRFSRSVFTILFYDTL